MTTRNRLEPRFNQSTRPRSSIWKIFSKTMAGKIATGPVWSFGRALREASAKRDLETTPKAYAALTTSCVECHRYLSRSRLAGK